MNKNYYLFLLSLALIGISTSCKQENAYKTLIITGQSEHNWNASSPILKKVLDGTGLFSSDILVTPEKEGNMAAFNPDFSKYKLVVLDYNGDSWSDKTNEDFVEYVRNGGGVVVYHGSSAAFPGWKEYNEIAGLGLGGGRNEKNGPYVYYLKNELVGDTTAGPAGSHGDSHEFEVRIRITDHPVTKGLPVRWMHGSDDLYQKMRGPAENMQVLATAFADTAFGGTGRDEPMLMAINYGKGRVFHTAMGHADDDGGPAVECAGFIVTLQRGAEWAATGSVTQEVPSDFPTTAGVILRPDYDEITMEKALAIIGNYDIPKSTRYLTFLQSEIRKAGGDEAKLLDLEKKMTGVLKNNETSGEAKKLILRELSWMGSDYCLPALNDLAADEDLKEMAEFALNRLQHQ
jgi:type 1 glutamine amidotransferase